VYLLDRVCSARYFYNCKIYCIWLITYGLYTNLHPVTLRNKSFTYIQWQQLRSQVGILGCVPKLLHLGIFQYTVRQMLTVCCVFNIHRSVHC